MFIFLYGQDTYRSLQKLNEIIDYYRKIQQGGLNLKYFDFKKDGYENFYNETISIPMLGEKKLLVLKNVSLNESFKKNFYENFKKFLNSKDIILFFEKEVSEKDKFFRLLKKSGKFQRFQPLEGERLKNWAKKEFEKEGVRLRTFDRAQSRAPAEVKTKIDPEALNQLINYVGNDLWRLSGEIKKLTSYKIQEKTPVVAKKDVDLLVKPKIELDIFKTIDALGVKNKKQALSFIHQHLEKGDSPLYLLSMINFQFRNLLIIKSQSQLTNNTQMMNINDLSKKLRMHPYVVRKTIKIARKFSLEELKKIYQKIFQVDLEIKTGKTDPETALDVLITEI